MTRAEWKCLARYIRWMANELGLRDWTIRVHHEPPSEDNCGGMICPVTGRKIADMWVCAGFRDRKPEEQRAIVLHELLHVHLAGASDVVRLNLWESHALPETMYKLLYDVHHNQIEYAVDGITESIASRFPLIEWPKAKAK